MLYLPKESEITISARFIMIERVVTNFKFLLRKDKNFSIIGNLFYIYIINIFKIFWS